MKKVFILLQGSFISMLLAACGNMKVTEEEVVKATEAGLYLKKYWKGKLDRLSVNRISLIKFLLFAAKISGF